jgi:hypothetical protein
METYDGEEGEESRTLLRVEKVMETWRALEVMRVLTGAVAADAARAWREGTAVLIDIDGTREILDPKAIEMIKAVLRKHPPMELTEELAPAPKRRRREDRAA